MTVATTTTAQPSRRRICGGTSNSVPPRQLQTNKPSGEIAHRKLERHGVCTPSQEFRFQKGLSEGHRNNNHCADGDER